MRKKKIISNTIYLMILGLFVWVVYSNIDDYEALLYTIQNADWIAVGYATLFSLGNLLFFSLIIRSNFELFSKDRFNSILQTSIASMFLNITTPLGTAGGNAYFLAYLRNKGFTFLKAFFAIISSNLSHNIGFFILWFISIRYLYLEQDLNGYQITATIILLVATIVMILMLVSVLALPQFNLRFAKVLVRFINWFSIRFWKKDYIDDKRFKRYEQDLMSMSEGFNTSILKFLGTLKYSFAFHILNIIILHTIFTAFGTEISISALVTIYSVIVLFSIVSPTPQGIGVAEGFAHLTAISIDVAPSSALMSILLFRLLTIWLPAFLGFVIFRGRVNSLVVKN